MKTLDETRTDLAEYERVFLADGQPRYLFRGQKQQHGTITSTFARLPKDDAVLTDQAHTVYRRGHQIGQGLRGYRIRPLEGAALLQHYGWPTPLIDVTGVVEVAIFFALYSATVGHEAVVYVIDRQELPGDIVVVDHDFLTHEVSDGALRHRWLRQDGFAIAPGDWQVPDRTSPFDLLSSRCARAITPHPFLVRRDDVPAIRDLLDQSEDPIPMHLQNLLRLYCVHQFGDELHPYLKGIVDEIPDQPRAGGA